MKTHFFDQWNKFDLITKEKYLLRVAWNGKMEEKKKQEPKKYIKQQKINCFQLNSPIIFYGLQAEAIGDLLYLMDVVLSSLMIPFWVNTIASKTATQQQNQNGIIFCGFCSEFILWLIVVIKPLWINRSTQFFFYN